MKTLIYFLIINAFLLGNKLIETNEFITPVVNLQETITDNQTSFIGFEGKRGQQKKAQLYSITEEGDLTLNKKFVFDIAEKTGGSFFSAHYGNFINTDNKSLVIFVADPSTGTKAYVWSILNGEFKREYEVPYVVNPENKKSLPVFSQTNKTDGKEEIIISFGSPNRNITKLTFSKDKITKEQNIAKSFLQNQAGSIFFLNNEEKDELIVFNGGSPTQSKLFSKNKENEKIINSKTEGTINQAFFINKKPALLTNFNKVYLYESQQTINLNPLYKHKRFIKNTGNKLVFIDSQGAFLLYEFSEGQATLINKEKSPFSGLQNINKIEFLIKENQTILTAQTKEKNYFIVRGKKEKRKKENKNIKKTKTDTVILTVNKEEYIPINIKEDLDFLELTIKEKPDNLELSLDSMAFVWKPLEKNIGNNILQYNIIYSTGESSLKTEKKEGQTTLSKDVLKEEYEKNKVLYVNAVPTIETKKNSHEVQAGHSLEIPFIAQDLNTEQKIKVTYEPPKENIEIKEGKLTWNPQNSQYGEHVLTLKVNDKYSESSVQNTVFVDTVKQIKTSSSDFVLTVNEEFVHNLSILDGKEYNKIKGPENIRISQEGVLHWIPIVTQLGENEIIIERKNSKNTENYIIKTFVNSPPVISFRPDQKEYISLNEDFVFQLKSFDSNEKQKIFWEITSDNKEIALINQNTIEWTANELDYHFYTITATDSIDSDVFEGSIYVNDAPVIVSNPQTVVQPGSNYNYDIIATDNNLKSSRDFNEENMLSYVLEEGPTAMQINKNVVSWLPTKEDIGKHNVKVLVSDQITTAEQPFVINVNDVPEIFSPDSIKILVGDTLNHFINATDNNTKTKLTYSIRTTIEEMYLNANTGQITWVPKEKDLGKHIVEVAVSDGFEAGTNMQKITIFVDKKPKITNKPPTEAYVGLDYIFVLKGEDALGNHEPDKDVFATVDTTSFFNFNFNSSQFIFETTPQIQDLGNQTLTFELSDAKGNKIQETFNILVLENSPCDLEEEIKEEKTTEKTTKKMKRIYKIIIGALLGGATINNTK